MENQTDDNELERVEIVDGSDVIRRGMFGLENSEILVFLLGLSGTGGVLWLTNLPIPQFLVVPFVPVPLIVSLLFIVFFMHGKPPHYFGDYIEGRSGGDHYKPFGKYFSRMPDGMFSKHVLVWDGLTSGMWSCGMELEVPSLDYAKNATKNHFLNRSIAFLNVLAKEKLRVQLYWSVNSNYTSELARYASETDLLPDGAGKKYRQLRYEAYRKKANARQLRRERLIVFVSRPLKDTEKVSWNKSLRDYDETSKGVFADLERTAMLMFARLRSVLEPAGIRCRELDSQGLAEILRIHFNPSASLAPRLFSIRVNNELSIKEQTVFSDICAPAFSKVEGTKQQTEGGAAFQLDGQYYNVIALKSPLPKVMYFGIVNELTKLIGILDYEIVCNIVPRDAKKVLQQEENALKVLENQRTQKNSPASLDFAYRQRYEMVGELFSERTVPLDCQYFIYVHGISGDELMVKTTSIKGALTRIGVGYYVLNQTTGAINAFFQGTPGWLWGGREGHRLRTTERFLAPLLPFSSTYTGLLDGAEAIYDGEQANLVGVKQFAKAISADSDPQHTLLFGKTGSGKSVLTCDLLMQTYGFYAYTVILDYGLSYKVLAENLGSAPICLGPASNITINYFDTQQTPLTGEHLSLVSTVLRVMSDGLASDGMIMRYLKPFYIAAAQEWYDANESDAELMRKLKSVAYLTEKYLSGREAEDEAEAYKKALADWETHPFADGELNEFFYSNPEPVFYQAFAYFRPEEYPTHTRFVNFLRSKTLEDEEDFKRLQEVTDALELWRADGKNGRLFDGLTNLEMNDTFQYFELSGVPSNDANFKFAAGALIQMLAMRKIERMDRTLKKRLIVDEANSLFEIPQGAKIMENALTKFRKHRCTVLLSFQQYEMLNQSDIKSSITSNIQQYLLMGQTDKNEVDNLAHALGLSGNIKEAVLGFETPANLPPGNRYSSFAQVVKTRGGLSGIARNAMSGELLDMIGSK